MSQDIDNWDVDNGFELPQELVSYHGSKHGAEVAEHGEGVVDCGAFVMVKMELLIDVNAEDRFHAIVWQPFTEFIAKNQKHSSGVGSFSLQNKITDEKINIMFQLTWTGSPWKASPLLSASLRLASRSRVAMVRRSVNCVRRQQLLMTRTGQGIHPVPGPSPAPLMWGPVKDLRTWSRGKICQQLHIQDYQHCWDLCY